MSRPMNDDEVLTELKKMVAFIRQEATEKAHEIQVKADEEFAIEKARIVHQAAGDIETSYDKKKKHVEVEQKIAKSNQSNKARLQILQTREENLDKLFDLARERLTKLSDDQSKYSKLLEDLLLQGLLELHEPKVSVTARSTDVQLVQDVSKAAIQHYKELTGRDTEVQVQEGLPKDSAGGLLLTTHGGKIQLNNTLEERLRLLEDRMLPELRFELFGPNKDRKFFT